MASTIFVTYKSFVFGIHILMEFTPVWNSDEMELKPWRMRPLLELGTGDVVERFREDSVLLLNALILCAYDRRVSD